MLVTLLRMLVIMVVHNEAVMVKVCLYHPDYLGTAHIC